MDYIRLQCAIPATGVVKWLTMIAVAEKRETHNVGVRIPTDVYEPLAKIAAAEDRSLNAQIVRCLRECVQREQAQAKPERG